jgi:methylthioribose-1-phosphate isomerase
MKLPETLRWDGERLTLLDQRKLPHEIVYLEVNRLEDAWHAIKSLAVRGAPAIGIAAAYALAQSLKDVPQASFARLLERNAEYLKSARPTAVNLAWAVDRLAKTQTAFEGLIAQAQAIHREDVEICRAIGVHGSALINEGASILTHCNAGSLAVSELGTATAPIYTRHEQGAKLHVYVDETRPLYQGARLTAWELDRAGIDVTLICDNMAATLMAQGKVDLILVGTDRVTANGDVVNKIGTLGLAILADHFGVPFYVACPSSTYDRNTPRGDDVIIEERAAEEVRQEHAANVHVYNPAFDVTPNALVTGIITERGIARDPAELRAMHADG